MVASSFSSSSWLSREPPVAMAATLAVGLAGFTLPRLFRQTLELGVEYSSLLNECKLSELVLVTLSKLVVLVMAVDTLSNEPPYMIGLMLSRGLVLAEADVIVADLFLGLCLYFVRIRVSSDLEGGSLAFCNGTRWLLLPPLVALLRLLPLLNGTDDFGGSDPVDMFDVLLPFRMYWLLGNCCSLLLNSVVSRFDVELVKFGPGQLPRPGLDLTSFGSRGGSCSRLLFRLLLLLLLLFLSRLSKCFIEIPSVCDVPYNAVQDEYRCASKAHTWNSYEERFRNVFRRS